MRHPLKLCLLLALGGCAAGGHPHFRGPPPGGPGPGGGFGGPPHGGRLFLSPMGEPFRGEAPEAAWFRGADANGDGILTPAEFTHDAERFFALLDTNHDGEIDPDEIDHYEQDLVPEIRGGGMFGMGGGRPGGGGRRGHGGGGHMGGGRGGGGGPMGGDGPPDGEGASGGGVKRPVSPDYAGMGAARFSYLALPEPVTAADTNLNRGVSLDEFRKAAAQRFRLLDTNQDGQIPRGELPAPGGRRGHPPG